MVAAGPRRFLVKIRTVGPNLWGSDFHICWASGISRLLPSDIPYPQKPRDVGELGAPGLTSLK